MAATATFDPYTRTIFLTATPTLVDGELVVNVDVKDEIYSAGKEDWLFDPILRKLEFPIRTVGGQAIPTGFLDATYFLAPDWKIQPYDGDHRLLVDGNLFSEDGKSLWLTRAGRTILIEQTLSAIVGATFADEEAIVLAANYSADLYIYFDAVNGTLDPSADDAGTFNNPVRLASDALDLVAARGKGGVAIIEGTFSLDRDLDNLEFRGAGDPATSILNFNGSHTTRCSFLSLTLTGAAGADRLTAMRCILDGLSNCHGLFSQCLLSDVALDATSGLTSFDYSYSYVEGSGTPIVDVSGRQGGVVFRAYSGGIELRNVTNVLMGLSVDFISGHCRLAASCTDLSSMVLRGVGKFTNLSSIDASKIDVTGFQNPEQGALAVWLHSVTSYTTAGTFGNAVRRILSLAKALLGLS